MSEPKFSVGDVVADDIGTIGQVMNVTPGAMFPYRIREGGLRTGRYREAQEMRKVAPMKPIKVYQCKQDCCVVRVPSKRFWYVRTPKGRETFSSFRDATYYAGFEALSLPLEVTA